MIIDKLPEVLGQEHLPFFDFDNVVELNAVVMECLHQCSPISTAPKMSREIMNNLVLGSQKEFLHEVHEVVNRHPSGAG
jgi:hypothetical protein